MDQTLEAALFPIEGVVFFPTLTLPLNIFEPRYIAMINDCLETGRLLAVSDLDPAPGVITGVGSVQLFEKRADGTMVILVRGLHRGRIQSFSRTNESGQESPYFRGMLEVLPESPEMSTTELAEPLRFFLQRLKSGMRDWAAQALPDAASREAFLEGLDEPRRLIETYAHFKIQDCDIRQQILETQSLDARVELLRRVI